MSLGKLWLVTSCLEKLVLNGFVPDPMTTSRLAIVSWIPVSKEDGCEARAPRGLSGASLFFKVFGCWAVGPIILILSWPVCNWVSGIIL